MNMYERDDLAVGTEIAVGKYSGRHYSRLVTMTYGKVISKSARQIKTDTGHSFRVNDGCLWGVEKYSWQDDTCLHFVQEGRQQEKYYADKRKTEIYNGSKRSLLVKMCDNYTDDKVLLQQIEDLKLLMEEYLNGEWWNKVCREVFTSPGFQAKVSSPTRRLTMTTENVLKLTEDAYSRGRYGKRQWRLAIEMLSGRGLSDEDVATVLNSKWPRYAADDAEDPDHPDAFELMMFVDARGAAEIARLCSEG